MPFSIELEKTGTSVKLEIVKNTISIYFYGSTEEKNSKTLRAWGEIDGQFLESMPEFNADWIRGPDAPHFKKNHTNEGELEKTHFHREFKEEINPSLLSAYLSLFELQQNKPNLDVAGFVFLAKGDIETIVGRFSSYYEEYKGSRTEELFEEAAQLLPKEEESYEEALREHNGLRFFFKLLNQRQQSRKIEANRTSASSPNLGF